MSYIKFPFVGKGVDGATLDVGIKFGFLSYESIVTDKNRSLMFDDEGNVLSAGIAKIIYSGYVNNCINKNIEAVLTIDDFAKEINHLSKTDEGIEVVKSVINAWKESTEIKEATDKATEEEKKSQLTGENIVTESDPPVTDSSELSPGN